MFRVRFYVPGDRITVGPSGYGFMGETEYIGSYTVGSNAHPSNKSQKRTQVKLAALLKKQGMVFSHTDDAGFACYLPSRPNVKTKRARRPKVCPNCGSVV